MTDPCAGCHRVTTTVLWRGNTVMPSYALCPCGWASPVDEEENDE